MRICIVSASVRPDGDFVYPYVHPLREPHGQRPKVGHFNGRPERPEWPNGALIVAAEPPGRELGDFPQYASAGCLAMSARAHDELSSVLEPCGEILPLRVTDGTPLFLFNPLPFYDCVDPARSLGPRGRDGHLLDITTFEFVRERIPIVPVFKSKNSWSTIFSIEDRDGGELGLQSLVELHGLKGLTFREVWNDVQEGIRFEHPRIE